MSFKAAKVVEALCQLYRDNSLKMEELDRQLEEPPPGQWHGLNGARGYYTNVNQLLLKTLRAGDIDPLVPINMQMLTVERTMALCERRGWPADWQSRMAYLVEEASEYFSALRGKGSQDVEGEGGDLLNCLYAALAISGIDPVKFEERMVEKVNRLWDAPRRPGEHYETSPKPTRLTQGWRYGRPAEDARLVWVLLASGEVYPAIYRAWIELGDHHNHEWSWEDGELIPSECKLRGWLPREINKPQIAGNDSENGRDQV